MRRTLADRLWEKVERRGSADCWEFRGYTDPETGYGKIWHEVGKPPITASHATWLVAHGPVPEGHVVLTCPLVQNCCNPEHVGVGVGTDVGDRILWRKRLKRNTGRARPRQYKLSDTSIIRIRTAPPTVSHAELAERHNVSVTYISLIRANKRRQGVTSCSPSTQVDPTSTVASSPPSTTRID